MRVRIWFSTRERARRHFGFYRVILLGSHIPSAANGNWTAPARLLRGHVVSQLLANRCVLWHTVKMHSLPSATFELAVGFESQTSCATHDMHMHFLVSSTLSAKQDWLVTRHKGAHTASANVRWSGTSYQTSSVPTAMQGV